MIKINVLRKPTLLGIGIDVEESFIHCPRALKKARIWGSATWQNKETLPSVLEIFHAHLKINGIDIKE